MTRIAAVVLGLWVTAAILVGGLLLAPHLISLEIPQKSDTHLRDAIAGASLASSDHWSAAHFMYRSCACSRRTIAYLMAAARPADLDELVVMVDDTGQPGAEDAALRTAGFRVVVITPEILRERFHIEAAPLLVVARPDRELAYVGGYSRHKQSAAYEDNAIVADLRGRAGRTSLPVFGCATNERLADAIDPLRLRKW